LIDLEIDNLVGGFDPADGYESKHGESGHVQASQFNVIEGCCRGCWTGCR
jgi:hypothetical protein